MRTVARVKGALSSISFLIDYDTLESCTREEPPRNSVGTYRVPRKMYKYDPRCFLELLRAAINAYLEGDRPTACSHERMGAIVTFIAKQLLAVKISEFRPVASICAKFCNDGNHWENLYGYHQQADGALPRASWETLATFFRTLIFPNFSQPLPKPKTLSPSKSLPHSLYPIP
jgi:hypothetical protein